MKEAVVGMVGPAKLSDASRMMKERKSAAVKGVNQRKVVWRSPQTVVAKAVGVAKRVQIRKGPNGEKRKVSIRVMERKLLSLNSSYRHKVVVVVVSQREESLIS